MQEKPKENSNLHSNVVVQALSMAFGTMSSRVLGLVRDMAFASLFDRTLTDAWTTAFRIPNMFRRLLGEGALSVSFIPVFVESRMGMDHEVRSRNLVNGLYTLLLLLLVTLTTLGIIFTEPILNIVVEETFKQIPGKFELTARMTRIMFSFLFMISSYAYFMGILNALGKFALAAFAPVLWNITMICSNFIPTAGLPSPGDALSWGVVVGGALQAGILVPALIRANYLPRFMNPLVALKNADIQRVFRNMLPGMVGLGLLQITTIINTRFASELGEGPISYIYFADRLMELPLSLVSVSLGTALLPTLARFWSSGEQQRMRDTANYYLRLNLFVAVPAAIGLWRLALPIVEVLFQRGKFGSTDAAGTALVVSIYSLIVFSTSCVRVLVPSFYAIKNTWLPAAVSAVCLVSHIILAPFLMSKFGLAGLILSTFMTSTLNLALLLFGYHHFIGSFGIPRVLMSLIKFLVAGFFLGLALEVYQPILSFLQGGGHGFLKLISLLLTISFGILVYGGISWLLRTEELTITLSTLIEKVRARRRRSV